MAFTLYNNSDVPISDVQIDLNSLSTGITIPEPNTLISTIGGHEYATPAETFIVHQDTSKISNNITTIQWNLSYIDTVTQDSIQQVFSTDLIPFLPSADFTGDGMVDLVDLEVLSQAWMTTPWLPNWNPKCDIAPLPVPDNKIDLLDFVMLSQSWLED